MQKKNTLKSRSKRPVRRPIGEASDILNFEQEPGFVYRVVNDNPHKHGAARIKRFQEAGYEIVQEADCPGGDERVGAPSQMGTPVQKSVGGDVTGVLMRIPKKWFDEDQAKKMEKIDKAEEGMKRLLHPGTKGNVRPGGYYGNVEIGTRQQTIS